MSAFLDGFKAELEKIAGVRLERIRSTASNALNAATGGRLGTERATMDTPLTGNKTIGSVLHKNLKNKTYKLVKNIFHE